MDFTTQTQATATANPRVRLFMREVYSDAGRDQLKKRGLVIAHKPSEIKPGNALLSHSQSYSTIAAEALHFRVRYGNGCFFLALITGKTEREWPMVMLTNINHSPVN